MSKLSKELTVKQGETEYKVPFYTTVEEASSFGNFGTAIVDDVVCYYPLGRGKAEETGLAYKTPLMAKKDSIKYYVLTKGNN